MNELTLGIERLERAGDAVSVARLKAKLASILGSE